MIWLLSVLLALAVMVGVEVSWRRRRARIASHLEELPKATSRVEQAAATRRIALARARERARARRPRHSRPPYPVTR